MDTQIILYIVGAILGIAGIASFARGKEKVLGMSSWIPGLIGLSLGVGLILMEAGILTGVGLPALVSVQPQQPFAVVPTAPTSPTVTGLSGACAYQPKGEFATKDKFSTTSVSGTSYYKPDALPATTTATTDLNRNTEYTYWVSNASYYVKPVTLTAGCGTNTFTASAWSQTNATLTAYDLVNHNTVSSGGNISLGGNGQANVQVTYQGTAKKSAGPFGGVMVAEYDAGFTSVTATGDQILSSNPYHLTYTVTGTDKTYKQWAYSADLDDGTGNVRLINFQYKNGVNDIGAGLTGNWTYIKLYPANYYITNNGNIVLDTEKYENDDTTKTFLADNPQIVKWGFT